MSGIRLAAMTIGIILAVLLGAFLLIGTSLPGERQAKAEGQLCHSPEQVFAILEDPEELAVWFFPADVEAELGQDRVRWYDNGRWTELRLLDSTPAQLMNYEFEVEDRFSVPIEVHLAADESEGTQIHIRSLARVETILGRWLLASPDILARLGLPHQTLDEAIHLIIEHAEPHLAEKHGPCKETD